MHRDIQYPVDTYAAISTSNLRKEVRGLAREDRMEIRDTSLTNSSYLSASTSGIEYANRQKLGDCGGDLSSGGASSVLRRTYAYIKSAEPIT